ncbi:MAG: phasin family protein, partial [Pseudomonadota bacterium]
DTFARMGERLSLPKVTVESVLDHHRRNIEALQQAAKNTSEGAQEAMAIQRDALEDVLADITETVQGTKLTDPPMQQMAAQAEFAKRSFDATVKNVTEIGSIARDTTKKNTDILRERVQHSIADIKTAMEKGEDAS